MAGVTHRIFRSDINMQQVNDNIAMENFKGKNIRKIFHPVNWQGEIRNNYNVYILFWEALEIRQRIINSISKHEIKLYRKYK